MKTPFVQLAGLTLWGALSVFTLPNQAFSGDENLQEFRTETGECTVTERSYLLKKQSALMASQSHSFTTNETVIYKNRGFSPKTDTVIPPQTKLNCLARSVMRKMLVTAADPAKAYCGWIDVEALGSGNRCCATETVSENDLGSGTGLLPCDVIPAINLQDFCNKMEKFGRRIDGCARTSIINSASKTKFVTNKAKLYSTAQSVEVIASVSSLNNLEVFDIAINSATDGVRLLVGLSEADLKGWIDYNLGTVINVIPGAVPNSKLLVYFSESSSKKIYQSEIGNPTNQILAAPPENLQQVLKGNQEFPKYPILSDRRLTDETTPTRTKPQLHIALVGDLSNVFTAQSAKVGFIETAPIGEKETNWDYFLALEHYELYRLNSSMEAACHLLSIVDNPRVFFASGIIFDSLRAMVETLTGDLVSADDFTDYWQNRSSIPLIDQTILGDGIKQFLSEGTTSEEIAAYKKKFCRAFELTSLIKAGKKLPEPYEGGSLTWQGEYYEAKDAVEHNWLYKDVFERSYYHIPLSYLPNWSN